MSKFKLNQAVHYEYTVMAPEGKRWIDASSPKYYETFGSDVKVLLRNSLIVWRSLIDLSDIPDNVLEELLNPLLEDKP